MREIEIPHQIDEDDASDTLSERIEAAVREHLVGGEIVEVRSHRGVDFDGDEIITITVVVNARPSDFPPHRLASLTGKLRSTLASLDEHAFPMISFLSPKEFAGHR